MAYIFSSLALIISVICFFYLRAYVKKRTSIERIPRETREAVGQIINEIDEKTYRDALLVEERVKTLKTLLDEADRRIAVFRREVESRKRRDTAYSELGRTGGGNIKAEDKPKQQVSSPLTEQAPPLETTSKPAAPGQAPPPANSTTAESAGQGSDKQTITSKKEEVLKLAGVGLPPSIIASKLNMTIGEIDMIIMLNRK